MISQPDLRKPFLATSNLDIPKAGPGKAARAWVNSLGGLSRGELAVALAFAWYCDGDGYCWPSRYSIAVRSRYTVRSVQSLTESLIGRGVLIEAGSKVTRSAKDGRPIKRTRLYRLALAAQLEPVVPAAERRRLARASSGESAKIALSIGAENSLSRVQKLHSPDADFRPVESAKIALSRPVESAKIAHNPKSNPGNSVAAAEGLPLEPAAAAPSDCATNVVTVAARELIAGARELTAAELEATTQRRRLALSTRGARWWDAQPVILKTAHDRPSGQGPGGRKDWRRGAKT